MASIDTNFRGTKERVGLYSLSFHPSASYQSITQHLVAQGYSFLARQGIIFHIFTLLEIEVYVNCAV